MLTTQEERSYASWCHLASLCYLLGVPFGHLLGPFVVWQMKKNESAYVDEQGKESLNFQLSMLIYTIAAVLVMVLFFIGLIGGGHLSTQKPGAGAPPPTIIALLVASGFIGPVIGLLIFPFIDLLLTIIAAMKASSGEHFRYPFTIRFLR